MDGVVDQVLEEFLQHEAVASDFQPPFAFVESELERFVPGLGVELEGDVAQQFLYVEAFDAVYRLRARSGARQREELLDEVGGAFGGAVQALEILAQRLRVALAQGELGLHLSGR